VSLHPSLPLACRGPLPAVAPLAARAQLPLPSAYRSPV